MYYNHHVIIKSLNFKQIHCVINLNVALKFLVNLIFYFIKYVTNLNKKKIIIIS